MINNTTYDFNTANNYSTIDYDGGTFLNFSNPLVRGTSEVQNYANSFFFTPMETVQDAPCKPNFPVEEKAAPATISTATNSCSPNASTENTYTPARTTIWTEDSFNDFAFGNNNSNLVFVNNMTGMVEEQQTPCESPQEGAADTRKGPKNKQSLFKNKYKELLEQAKALLDDIYKWSIGGNFQAFQAVKMEASKSDQEWKVEGDYLHNDVRLYEEEEKKLEKVQEELENLENDVKREKSITTELNKLKKKMAELSKIPSADKKAQKRAEKQLEKIKGEERALQQEKMELKERLGQVKTLEKRKKGEQELVSKMLEARKAVLLEALEAKRYSKFVEIMDLITQIKTYVNKKESLRYFDAYKKKRSMKYLEECKKSDELYYWIVLIKIVLTMLPENKENLRLLPLQKETASFMYWMVESDNMKVKHRTLFKSHYVRSKLRSEFTRVCNVLVEEARNKVDNGEWTQEKWDSMVQVLSAGEQTRGLALFGDVPTPMGDESNPSTVDSTIGHTPKRIFEDFDYYSDSHDMEASSPRIQKKIFKDYY